MGAIMISKYITRQEYQCRCCDGLPPDYKEPYDLPFEILFDSFALIRERWGAPLNITSGYRCPGHNSFVGGHPLSIHQWGLALDVDVDDYRVDDLHKIIIEEAPDLRVGKYPGFVHIDTGYCIYPRARKAWKKKHRWIGTS